MTVQRLAEDGALELADGRVIPPTFRAFAPAFLLREVPQGKTRPEVILAEAPKSDARAWALGIRPRKLIVFSADPERFAGELACEQAFVEVQKRLKKTLRFVSGEGEFVPSLERCEKIISLHEGNIRVGGPSEIATPGQECIPVSPEVSRKKSAEVEEEEPKKAVKKPDEAPVLVPEEPVQRKPKKESEDQQMK